MKQPQQIIEYWYAEEMRSHWFASTSALDNLIRDRYETLWEQAAVGQLDTWKETPEGCLALAIILDQFPLNMFRNQAKSFATEGQAIEVTLFALDQGFDKQISSDKLEFLIMPLMHSEKLTHQDLAVTLFAQYDLADNLRFAQHHRDIIRRFGRFPHRNAILGRDSTEQELAYLQSKEAFQG
jgi:uncharacterized protein (DUF924 family)